MEKLKRFRQEQGLTQEAMARRLGFTLSMYEKVEAGRTRASASFMRHFKDAFPKVSIDSIFFSKRQQ